jgi:hypothetical protein
MRQHGFDFGFVSPGEAARALHVCQDTLRRWRASGRGPAFTRIEGKVWYPLPMLGQYVQSNTCQIGQREVS